MWKIDVFCDISNRRNKPAIKYRPSSPKLKRISVRRTLECHKSCLIVSLEFFSSLSYAHSSKFLETKKV